MCFPFFTQPTHILQAKIHYVCISCILVQSPWIQMLRPFIVKTEHYIRWNHISIFPSTMPKSLYKLYRVSFLGFLTINKHVPIIFFSQPMAIKPFLPQGMPQGTNPPLTFPSTGSNYSQYSVHNPYIFTHCIQQCTNPLFICVVHTLAPDTLFPIATPTRSPPNKL